MQMKPWLVSTIWMGILAASHAPLPVAGRVAMGLALTVPLLAGYSALYVNEWRGMRWRLRGGWYVKGFS